jgi:hypothetical protein
MMGANIPPEKTTLVTTDEPSRRADVEEREDPRAPKVGRWFWVTTKDHDDVETRWLGCVVHVGSNYAELEDVGGSSTRVHEDEWDETCELEPNAKAVIAEHVRSHQIECNRLMSEVQAITRRLAVAPNRVLGAAPVPEAKALAVYGKAEDLGKYKKALSKAKEKELPELFAAIEAQNKMLGRWLKAELIPLKAEADAMRPAIDAIEDRIFSVELYAGLSEEVALVKDGEAAPAGEKIRLYQRRAYMDEECLARYEAGGMEFKDIEAFDAWLARPGNFTRLLPHPRCVVAFQVRRHDKERDWGGNLSEFIHMRDLKAADKATFLYMRNGEKLFRLSTAIDFDEKLFPDMDHKILQAGASGGKLYARVWSGSSRVENIISEDEYLEMVREYEEKKRKAETAPPEERWRYLGTYLDHYEPFTRESVHYDDIHEHIQGEIKKHNRLALVLQGLLDRSPVFHPHPPWSIWTGEGFEQALELLYDDSRALTAGDKPDFEAYRKRLNASLGVGSITVGQDDAWEIAEAEKESERRDRDWRHSKESYRPSRFRPYGNPGPGVLARVIRWSKTSGKATFEWDRERQKEAPDGSWDPVRCSFVCPSDALLNVTAYQLGDFRQFFEDPRTRAEYLQWAPLLLVAEEMHAGKRETPKPLPPPKKKHDPDGALRYRRRKRAKALVGKTVRLLHGITTTGGDYYDKGTLWRVTYSRGATLTIVQAEGGASVRGVEPSYLEVIDAADKPVSKEDL